MASFSFLLWHIGQNFMDEFNSYTPINNSFEIAKILSNITSVNQDYNE